MKMVAAAKLRGAQAALDVARVFQAGVSDVWQFDIAKAETDKVLYVPLASDRGLCGGVNSVVSRAVRDELLTAPKSPHQIFILGDKSRAALERMFGERFTETITEMNKFRRIPYKQVSMVADHLLAQEYDRGVFVYNKFKNMISYETKMIDFPPFKLATANMDKLYTYELEGDPDIMRNFYEFQQAVRLYHFLVEGEASEQSSRMNAMGNSSSAAADMHKRLELQYNRLRQAKITTELIEIISGALALDDAN
jgi:F-type H+-transporting ATPase subunit gamma